MEVEATMRATVRRIGDVAVIDLSGNIPTGVGDSVLRDKVFELLDKGQRHILLNLERVSYMDACGMGELVALLQARRGQGRYHQTAEPFGQGPGPATVDQPQESLRDLLRREGGSRFFLTKTASCRLLD